MTRRLLLAPAMGAFVLLGVALNAQAAPCVPGPVASYETAGFSCSVGPVTYSNSLGNFTPFSVGNEFGLSLNYIAVAGGTPGITDVAYTMSQHRQDRFSATRS
jgi:hypothetical protein